MSTVASFHLTRYPARHALATMAGLAIRQRALAATPGLRFARQLGTGRGSAMGLSADLRRWATFAVWEGDDALEAFLATSPVAAGWMNRGEETWTVRLAPLSAHGAWAGTPLAHLEIPAREPGDRDVAATVVPSHAGDSAAAADSLPDAGGDSGATAGSGLGAGADAVGRPGPVAVLTRARVAVRHWPAFYRSVPAVEDHLQRQPGLLAVVGIGEAPVGLQATFSLWRSADDVEAFAYQGSVHEEVVRRTRAGGWFAEELFARFRPYRWAGTWDGSDPLAAGRRAGGNGS